MRQRIAGLFCAVSMAWLIASYISCVSAFFFSGRRNLMMRGDSSSVTMTWGMQILSRQCGRVTCLTLHDPQAGPYGEARFCRMILGGGGEAPAGERNWQGNFKGFEVVAYTGKLR